MSAFVEFAPAKINLGLSVGVPDVDGYHPLGSLVVFASVGDRLSFNPAPDLVLRCNGPFGENLGSGPDNLVLRAARALQSATGTTSGAHITLHKTLPVASGIGGGSADAAASLRGLNQMWNCGLKARQLENIGADIGADIPVCVQSRARYMRGRGEILEDVSGWPALDAVLINPGISVATKDVFARFDQLGLGAALTDAAFVPASHKNDALIQLESLTNDLTIAACEEVSVIGELLGELAKHPKTHLARLCGSGATCMALTTSAQEATDLAAELRLHHPQYWIRPVTLGISSRAQAPS